MMSADEVQGIESRLSESFPPPANVQVVADPFGGVQILIVSPDFIALTPAQRRNRVLSQVNDDQIARLELLTPDEESFFGTPSMDVWSDLENLPLWPEALAHGQAEQIELHLPSQTFTSLPPPVVATFYSLRGGVGRSTTLAHVARVLVGQEFKVLCIDMDLEAPGLASLFAVEGRVLDDKGVVPLLLQTEIDGTVPDLTEHLLRVTDNTPLYLLPAGLPNANYARQLALLDPSAWYREEINPLRLLIDEIQKLPEPPDVVLIDSRTGISPLAAPLLFDVADINIVTFYPHPQTRVGTGALVRALLAARSRRSTEEKPLSPEVRFVVSPVPAAAEVRALYSDRAQEWVREWLAVARRADGEPVFEALEDIIQVISYQETIATSDTVMDVAPTGDFDVVAAWVAGLVESPGADLSIATDEAGETGEPSKLTVLKSLTFAGETAEQQNPEELVENFLSTADVDKALSPETPVVIGRKGTGKTAIFRKLATGARAVVVTSPPGLETDRRWTPPQGDFYSGLAKELDQRKIEWRQVWPAIIGLAVLQRLPHVPKPNWITSPVGAAANRRQYRTTDLLRDLRTILEHPDAPLLAAEWLQQIDEHLTSTHLLLFDGLDTGFGNTDTDRRRRNDGVAGLLTTAGSMAPQLQHLKFKILLREDIWRETTVPNKSHLEARSARLSWLNQTDYLRVAIKQAWRSKPFKDLVSRRLNREDYKLEDTSIEYWREDFVENAWIILVGERLAGGRTAYTKNWIWSRLADANGDHSPRALAQLLTEATKRERGFEQGDTSYSKSIIRSRALVGSLDVVSTLALDALRTDEFPELEPVFAALTDIGATPFPANQLQTASNLTKLAGEVGLLETVSGPRDNAEKFRVPELYRKALNMTRKGQA